MYWMTLTAVSIVWIADSFEPNVGVETGFAITGEGQIPITILLYVVQHKASFFFAGTNTSCSLCVFGLRGFRGGLLTQS